MGSRIRMVPCLDDNYGFLIHDEASGRTASIDAPDAAPLLAALDQEGWTLSDILVTHHHHDHTGAIPALKARFDARVVAPRHDAARVPMVDEIVDAGDQVDVGTLSATVIETPGHTKGHAAYWFAAAKALFCGDTLFSLGCGRVFEGTPAQMWESLRALRMLPDDTRVYCAHEYTAANVRFALTIEPNNATLKARAAEVAQLRAADRPTVPTRLGMEKEANPFLRADVAAVAAAIGLAQASPADVFAAIRKRKDTF